MRDLYLLEPHTWVSIVPSAISEKLRNRKDVVVNCLTSIGPVGWQLALTNSGIQLPICRTRLAFVDFLTGELDANRILMLAITFTRIQIACHLRHRTEELACTIRGRDPLGQLNMLAMSATETLLGWKWAIPFDKDGVFDFDLWEHPDIPL